MELGDLTVVAGRNNTGKTYLVYTLYGFLTMWDAWPGPVALSRGRDGPGRPDAGAPAIFEQVLEQVAEEGHASLAVDRDAIDDERVAVLRALTGSFSEGALSTVFSSPPDAFEGASIGVELNLRFPEQRAPVEIRTRPDETASIRYDGTSILVAGSAPRLKRLDSPELLRYISRLYLRFLFPELPPAPFVLSAERFGISLFYKELDFTKNQLVDLLQKMGDRKERDRSLPFFLIDQSLSRYALPIKHNIDYTRGISDFRKQRSELHDERLFDDIKRLMDGYYTASNENIQFRSVARTSGRFAIPLHLASASARGLSDLYFFLRHVARKDHLLIIDEPEGHLDTANQVRLARLLARMVRVGLKVLLTTHSDYLVKEINNLIMLSSPFADKAEVTARLGYGEHECISPGTVRAYVAENNSLTRCKVDRFGIDMPIFDHTIDGINGVANELASRVTEDSAD